jgi:hypothetical protein
MRVTRAKLTLALRTLMPAPSDKIKPQGRASELHLSKGSLSGAEKSNCRRPSLGLALIHFGGSL